MPIKRTLIFAAMALVAGILISTAIAHAGFINDWITQKVESSPSYFEGQKRGYVSGGSFSARWPMSNDHLVSFETPRLKFGCGGIDAFMGGFSFLNFDYLVQKFQRILQNAPAAAFELALKNLCEPCATVMNTLEAMSTGLNNLKLDECHDSKVLTARIMSAFTDNPKIKQEAEKDLSIEQGWNAFTQALDEAIKADNMRSQMDDQRDLFTGCPAAFQDMFLTGNTSLLQNIGQVRGYSNSYIAFMRGLVGDVNIVLTNDPTNGKILINHHLVSPCPNNTNYTVDTIIRGAVDVKTIATDAACVPLGDPSLADWAINNVTSITTKMRTKAGALDANETAFLEHVPNIYSALRVAVATRQENAMMAELSEFAAKAYAQLMMQDFYGGIRQSFATLRTVMSKAGQTPLPNCQVDLIKPLDDEITKFQNRAQELANVTRSDYVKFVNEHVALMNVASKYDEFNKAAKDKLTKAFSSALANRAMGGM